MLLLISVVCSRCSITALGVAVCFETVMRRNSNVPTRLLVSGPGTLRGSLLNLVGQPLELVADLSQLGGNGLI